MSLGLLSADYASSSEDEESPAPEELLSNPFASSSKQPESSSVFSNPFLESEKKKESLLEKHVSLTPKQEDGKLIGGKKVCFNFRKGRCRFGHTCSFAHDSDVQIRKNNNNNAVESVQKSSSKRATARPGLGDSLNPSKKAKKLHDKIYNK